MATTPAAPPAARQNFDVSKRISEKLRAVIADVEARGGQLPSSGGLRPLNYEVNGARSATSFHYAALAVDLFTLSGGLNPTAKLSAQERAVYGREYVDQLVIQKEGVSPRGSHGFKWRVWCRSTKPDHPDVIMAPIQACQFRDRRGPDEREAVQASDPFVFEDDVEVHGPFFDLTKVFEAHGFNPIAGRPPWTGNEKGQRLSDIDYMEWWHFEISSHLSQSTRFGEVLLEIHEPKALVFSPPWRYRNAKYNGRGFE